MIGDWLAAMEAMAPARALRDSVWIYPLVNAGHILGVALLVGSIVPLDLRLLGAWRSVPLGALWRVLSRTAAVGLALAITCGALLFVARATEYAASDLFISKMAVVAAGAANAIALRMIAPDEFSGVHATVERPPRRVRLAGGVSLAAWLTALTLGRLVGYF
jgi:hypothetical protein